MTEPDWRPPATRRERVVERLHGVEIADDYRWLEGDLRDPAAFGAVTPEVAAWTDAQNAFTRQRLDGSPYRAAIEARLRPLMQIGAVTAPAMRGRRYFYSRREGDQNQPRIFVRESAFGDDRLLIDPETFDPTGLTTVEWISPSRDGALLAFGTYRSGDENTTLRLMDVDSARVLPLEIPSKVQSPFWLPDASGFVYQNLKDAADPYSGQVLFHRMGTDPAADPVLFRQFTPEENEKLATTWGPFGALSDDGRWLLLGYFVDTISNDLWLADFAEFLRTGTLTRVPVSVGEPGAATGTVVDDVVILHTTKGAPRGRIVRAPAATPGREHWHDVVPEHADAVIESAEAGGGGVVVTWMRHASNVAEVFELDGRSRGVIAQPGVGAVEMSCEPESSEAFLTFASFNHPTTVFRVDLDAPATPPELWAQPAVPVDPASAVVEQVWYPSKDGTSISMFIVRPASRTPGPGPVLLSGYGGFNISETPGFGPTLFQWLEHGGVYAVPNLRGGGEYGDAWHEAGMLDRKQNTFDDFLAAAEWLIANAYTTPDQLAISGGSNGGLLVGAAITQRPELFRAAVIAVPLLDMLRYQHFLMARYWVPEYGSSEDADQFRYLQAYSPYHRVVDGVRYPAVLLTAGEHDTRVHAMHARKMAARLQAATTADPRDRPVLLWVDRDAGHGQGKPLNLRLRDAVDARVFLLEQVLRTSGVVSG
jgi:prolyl oligopeptidase